MCNRFKIQDSLIVIQTKIPDNIFTHCALKCIIFISFFNSTSIYKDRISSSTLSLRLVRPNLLPLLRCFIHKPLWQSHFVQTQHSFFLLHRPLLTPAKSNFQGRGVSDVLVFPSHGWRLRLFAFAPLGAML